MNKEKRFTKIGDEINKKIVMFFKFVMIISPTSRGSSKKAELWRKVAAARESARKFKRHNSPFLLTARYSTARFKCLTVVL